MKTQRNENVIENDTKVLFPAVHSILEYFVVIATQKFALCKY
jgi:hypothetical protein